MGGQTRLSASEHLDFLFAPEEKFIEF